MPVLRLAETRAGGPAGGRRGTGPPAPARRTAHDPPAGLKLPRRAETEIEPGRPSFTQPDATGVSLGYMDDAGCPALHSPGNHP